MFTFDANYKTMRNQKRLLIEQLDRKLEPFIGIEEILVPNKGWIHSIRTTLNMTLEQLGKKLNITKQGVKRIEKSEASGTITLNSMREIGKALEMKFVYGFKPVDGSIEKLIDKKAHSLAERIVLRTHHNMMLENQETNEANIKKAIRELSHEIKQEMRKAIWD